MKGNLSLWSVLLCVYSDEASGEPHLKCIKTEDQENELIIEQNVEETYEEEPDQLYEQQLILKDEPE